MIALQKNGRQIAAIALIVVLLGGHYFTTFRWLGHEWWTNDYYSHGPLVVLISAFLAWRRRDALQRQSPAMWGVLLMGFGLASHIAGLTTKAMYLSALSLPLLLAGLLVFLMGPTAARQMAFPLAFLWLAVPLPFVEAASLPLQTITASVSTAAAQLLGIQAEVQGAQVTLSSCSLRVGAACSGLRSIVALLTLDVLFVYIIQGKWWAKAVLIALAVPIAIAANFIRVTALLVIADSWGREAGLHYFHDYSSPVLFVVAFLLLILLSWVLKCREIRSDI